MAIYHLEGKVISRSQGRSAVAAAAYRACHRLVDDRTGLVHDFSRKGADLVQAEVLLPARAPSQLADREVLWNQVELGEKRKDAQLCREFNIALPREFTEEQNWALAREFVQAEFVERGMVVDVAFHRGHKSQEGQPHIHVMLTMREITPDGFGKKVRAWNDRGLLDHWREAWATHCNRHFMKLGFDIRIDHRTLEAQGIDLEPQAKIGPTNAKARLARFMEHQDKARANGERLLAQPDLALKAIVAQQSTFTHRDIARVVHRYTVDAEQFNAVYHKVLQSPELVLLGKDSSGRDRYSTKTVLATERQLIEEAIQLSELNNHPVSPRLRKMVAKRYTLSKDQRVAYDYLLEKSDLRNLVGIAGSGKSYLLGAVRVAHEQSGHRVIGMALAGKAAENLTQSSGIESRTVASHIAAWDSGRDQLNSRDVVVIDEAGMLGSEQYARLLHEAKRHGAKVVSVFDTEQLQAISAGAPARATAERTGFVELTEVRRQHTDWQQDATRHFAMGETQEGLLAYEAHDMVHAFNTQDQAVQGLLENWQEVRSVHPDKEQLILAYTRAEVNALNEAARGILKANGELGKDHPLSLDRGRRDFAVGDRVYFLKNDYQQLAVRNGSLGTIEAIRGQRLKVRLDGDHRQVEFSLKDYNYLEYGYAATLHKSQGTTVDYTHVLANTYYDRHLTYVGMSRHREGANLYWSREVFTDFSRAAEQLSRKNTKDFTLDYTEIHGLEPKPAFTLQREATQSSPELEDRFEQAETRFHDQAFQRVLSRIEKNVGLTLSTDLKVGDRGVYRTMVEINEQRYGVLDIGGGQGKLVPKAMLATRRQGKSMEITQERDEQGLIQLRAIQHQHEKEQQLEREEGRDL